MRSLHNKRIKKAAKLSATEGNSRSVKWESVCQLNRVLVDYIRILCGCYVVEGKPSNHISTSQIKHKNPKIFFLLGSRIVLLSYV